MGGLGVRSAFDLSDFASCRAFAPEVIYYKGWFYMCESRRGQGHFLFRSANPNGPFEQYRTTSAWA